MEFLCVTRSVFWQQRCAGLQFQSIIFSGEEPMVPLGSFRVIKSAEWEREREREREVAMDFAN